MAPSEDEEDDDDEMLQDSLNDDENEDDQKFSGFIDKSKPGYLMIPPISSFFIGLND